MAYREEDRRCECRGGRALLREGGERLCEADEEEEGGGGEAARCRLGVRHAEATVVQHGEGVRRDEAVEGEDFEHLGGGHEGASVQYAVRREGMVSEYRRTRSRNG